MSWHRLQCFGVLLCIAVAVACARHGKDPSLEVPNAPWERMFFEELEKRTTPAGVSDLRKTVLPDQDLEMRFWYDSFEEIQGLILRRSGGNWSATYLTQSSHRDPTFRLKTIGPPQPEWEALWTRLVNAGVLTLPDQSQTNCTSGALDGIGYVVETNANRKYRTFHYSNPQLATCDEARRIQSIEAILGEAFGLADLQK